MANTKKIEEMLMTAIFEVFEKMYYLFVEPLRVGDGTYQMTSAISFKGPSVGMMYLSLSRGIVEEMVKNMLNLEKEEITEQVMADCVKESINMICGNFVRKLDPEKVFHLSIPTFGVFRPEPQEGEDGGNDIRLTFTAEGGYIEIAVKSEDLRQQA